jgi:hypothetical protein
MMRSQAPTHPPTPPLSPSQPGVLAARTALLGASTSTAAGEVVIMGQVSLGLGCLAVRGLARHGLGGGRGREEGCGVGLQGGGCGRRCCTGSEGREGAGVGMICALKQQHTSWSAPTSSTCLLPHIHTVGPVPTTPHPCSHPHAPPLTLLSTLHSKGGIQRSALLLC